MKYLVNGFESGICSGFKEFSGLFPQCDFLEIQFLKTLIDDDGDNED